MATVDIVMGSDSDWAVMSKCAAQLEQFGISYSVQVISAHRTPAAAHDFAVGARQRGAKVIIAAAGMSAALPGVMASLTTLPVIGVPLVGGAMDGLDALLSVTMMPPGVPVGSVGIGAARNAAILAAQIIGVADNSVAEKLDAFKKQMADEVAAKNSALQAKMNKS